MTSWRHERARWQTLATLGLFVVLAVVHTWPLATAPGTLSRNDTSDTVLHEWILAWVAHQLPRNPLQVFDANIFYPERNTLAYSDHLIPQALMVAPLLWAGGSPVLAYNLLLIGGFALTGWVTALVVWRWAGHWLAGVMSGSLMAFNAMTLTRLPQIQDQHMEFFPLALLALDRLMAEPHIRHGLRLGGWYALQALTCGYLLVFSLISLIAAALVRSEMWTTRRRRELVLGVLAAGLVAVVVLTPFLIPYYIVSRDHGLVRPLDEVAQYSANLTDYLATGGRLHFALWSQPFFRADALFPGLVALGLAGVAVLSGVAVRDRRARMALAFGALAWVLSFGPDVPLYRLLYHGFPLMSGIRGAVRFGQFFLAGVAILAGYGLATLLNRGGRGALTIAITIVVLANLEALRAPINYSKAEPISSVYDNLKKTGRGVVACFPFYSSREIYGNVRYMLPSTRFWNPMLNGYSGFTPASYHRHVEALAGFPDRRAIDYLRGHQVAFVVVEANRMSEPRLARLAEIPELRLWVTDGNVRIYVLM